jgi:hypothetical protein
MVSGSNPPNESSDYRGKSRESEQLMKIEELDELEGRILSTLNATGAFDQVDPQTVANAVKLARAEFEIALAVRGQLEK